MRLSVTLPSKSERKWKRISAYMGKDIDALLVAGIDYVWERFGKDIAQSERQTARYARKIKQAELSLSRLSSKVDGAFLGSFTRKANAKGIVRLPKCWLDAMASPGKLYGLRHGKQAICLFTENELEKCDENVKRKAVALSVSSSGRVKIDGAVHGFSCADRNVALRGQIRHIQAEVVQAKAERESARLASLTRTIRRPPASPRDSRCASLRSRIPADAFAQEEDADRRP